MSIPWKPHHKGLKRTPFKKSTTRTRAYKHLNPRSRSNRSTERRAWQAGMVKTYAHINWCEWPGCRDTFGLAHAHRLKKTKITDREEWLMIAKLCQKHHNWVEYGDSKHKGTHRRMYRLITTLILRREKI